MLRDGYFILIIFLLFAVTACSNTANSTLGVNDSNRSKSFDINSSNLDSEDDSYIELKSGDDVDKATLKDRAKSLALAHMNNREYILANFYIQEALSYEPNDKELKFLLVKNQYLAALNNGNSQHYLERAYQAIKENRDLISDYENLQKANELVKKVRDILENSYMQTSNFYKREGKIEAKEKYLQKIKELNDNI